MPVELNLVESVTELDTTVITVVLESASEPGPAGPGVAAGGTSGQVLTKDSGTDFDTSWQDASGGGVTDADYLVGTAHGDLSAEIVVGTSPGGELGGTWASPTVDTTHSGSSHASIQSAAEATAAGALASHESDTTGIHGITNTANLSLTGHAHAGEDITSGTVADARIASTIARDSEVTSAISTSESGQVRDGDAAGGVLGGTYPNPSFAADMATQAELDAHISDATAAHAATAIAFTPDGSISATTVQAAIVEVRDEAGGGGAPTDATYITQTANGTLSNEQALSALSTGVVKVTTTTGVLSTAVANTDYAAATHASRHQNGGADEISIAGLDGTSTELSNHLSDSSAAHAASAVSADSTTLVGTGTDVQAVLEELDNGIADHLADTSDAHDASAISFSPTGSIAATDVQAAIAEVASEAGGSSTKSYAIQLLNPRTSTLAGNSFFTVLALSDWDAGHWEMLLDVESKIYGIVRVPVSYVSGGAIKLEIGANATTGVTRLVVGTKAVADGESMNPTLTDETAQDITVPGTAYLRKTVSFTLTETLAASDLLLVEIFHDGDHANDTLAVNTLLWGAWLEVTA